MYTFEKIRQQLTNDHEHPGSEVLSRLMDALEQEEDFPIHELYDLSYSRFQVALDLLREWRLVRYYHPTMTQTDAPPKLSAP
ncbi:MAG: hypothetical protein PHU46_05390 [Rhodocyclaceae bacterium]|nr:hypothetical protein [Rhodocyclaceae bacterium]